MPAIAAFDQTALPAGIRSRFVNNVNGLTMHMLEAGFERSDQARDRPCVLLLHGFPELAYSWRKVMVPIAQAGFHVIAPDQRGYGRTIDVPSCFIAGKSDWGIYQKPGDFEKMQSAACTQMLGCHLVDGAGHWV
ncbi:MAG TPA: alpha/beta fold hydrolase, partial [Burkholderiales bacterium]